MPLRSVTTILLSTLAVCAMAQSAYPPDFSALLKDVTSTPAPPQSPANPYRYEINLPASGLTSFIGTDAVTTHEPVAEHTLLNMPMETITSQMTATEQAMLSRPWTLNINTAPIALMAQVPQLDFRLAQAIATHRTDNGPFARPQEIVEVFGVTEFTSPQLQSHLVCVGETTFDGTGEAVPLRLPPAP